MSILRIFITAFLTLSFLGASVVSVSAAGVSLREALLQGVESIDCPQNVPNCYEKTADSYSDIGAKTFLLNLLGRVLKMAAIVAVLILVIAGLRLVLAHGNQEAIQAAHKHILWTLSGLAVIIISLLIVQNITEVVYESLGDEELEEEQKPEESKEELLTAEISGEKFICTNGEEIDLGLVYTATNEGFDPVIRDNTIGIGHDITDDGKEAGTYKSGISEEEAYKLFLDDYDFYAKGLLKNHPKVRDFKYARQAVLKDITFQLGIGGINRLTRMWGAIEGKNLDFLKVTNEILFQKGSAKSGKTGYATQTPDRAGRSATLMRDGNFDEVESFIKARSNQKGLKILCDYHEKSSQLNNTSVTPIAQTVVLIPDSNKTNGTLQNLSAEAKPVVSASSKASDLVIAKQKQKLLEEIGQIFLASEEGQSIIGEIAKEYPDFVQEVAVAVLAAGGKPLMAEIQASLIKKTTLWDKAQLTWASGIDLTDVVEALVLGVKSGKPAAVNFLLAQVLKEPDFMKVALGIAVKRGIAKDILSKLPSDTVQKVVVMASSKPKLMKKILPSIGSVLTSKPKLIQEILNIIPAENQVEIALKIMDKNPKTVEQFLKKALNNEVISKKVMKNEKFVSLLIKIANSNEKIQRKMQTRILKQGLGDLGGQVGGDKGRALGKTAGGFLSDMFSSLQGLAKTFGGEKTVKPIEKMKEEMMKDPLIRQMVFDEVKKDPQAYLKALKPAEKSMIINFAMKDPDMIKTRNEIIEMAIADEDVRNAVIEAAGSDIVKFLVS